MWIAHLPSSVREVLTQSGAVAQLLGERFESRPQQLAMADAVAKAMGATTSTMIEAGTGVGKSFAYLVPAIERCAFHSEKVVIATNTIALQEQLVGKDIPLLERALGDRLYDDKGRARMRAVLVKGRGNYVSLRRLKMASERQTQILPDAASRRSLHVIEDWATSTEDGTLSTLPELERPAIWDRVQSDSGNCMGRRCPNYEACFYQSARREMEKANLLICNHALFFSDLALRAQDVGFLPKYDHVILDEAHGVEDVAAEHFGLSLTQGRVAHLLGSLYHHRTRKGYLGQLARLGMDLDLVNRAIELVAHADEASCLFFDDLVHLYRSSEVRNGRVRRPDAIANPLTPAMNDLALCLRRLREEVTNDPDRFELNAYAARAAGIADTAEALIAQTAAGACYWIELSDRSAGPPRVSIACSPIDVAPLLRQHLFNNETSVILTSATLATRTIDDSEPTERAETAFAHMISRLGCEGATTLQLGSPFDHASQVQLHVDRTMPQPNKGELDPTYLRELVSRIHDHVVATDGGAFVLFTSFKLLYAVADLLASPLESLGMSVFVQGRGGSRSAILEGFRASERGVLLGAASFWQGVDVQGDTLRNVIITRLPFDPPDRPLTEARLERIADRGGNPFMEDSLPRAIIRFKQGFGRLIRSKSDTGRVVILDPRIMTKQYGRLFLQALPEGTQIIDVAADQSPDFDDF
ncbi:MAG: helicase [Leptolyngbya sp. PLA3]|nr:MAG: helicase [Cyanobacteria bacterium CYA]MCE7969139.1 helicase [Leptolyngbya sp. PL-A3]